LRAVIGEVFPLEQATAAHGVIEERQVVGKVLLRV
jgi:NADPH:quinone reductase-like Zn-dependent oxidoreductase